MAIQFRLATRADNSEIQKLVNSVYQKGALQLGFQRAPDFFIGQAVIGQEHLLVVAEDDEKKVLAGLTNLAGRELYMNGQKRMVWYSGDTRVDFPYRRHHVGLQLFLEYGKHRGPGDLLEGIILKENTSMLEAIERGTAGRQVMDYSISHEIETSFIYVRKIKPRIPAGIVLRSATAADVPEMQAFFDREAPRRHGYPVYDFAKMLAGDPYYAGIKIDKYILALRDARIVGIVGSWDQKAFKQTRVLGYSGALKVLRPLINLYSAVVGGFRLPAPGGMLNYTALHTILIENDDQAVFRALVDWIMANDGKSYDALASALTVGDPLLEVLRGYKRQKLMSYHFWMAYGDNQQASLDKRPLYVELGRL